MNVEQMVSSFMEWYPKRTNLVFKGGVKTNRGEALETEQTELRAELTIFFQEMADQFIQEAIVVSDPWPSEDSEIPVYSISTEIVQAPVVPIQAKPLPTPKKSNKLPPKNRFVRR